MDRKVLNVRHYKAGYETRTEEVSMPETGTDKPVVMKSAYTLDGYYIGSSKRAYRLVVKRGIKPEKISPEHNVCSIGFSERDQQWYGWSHRAICGFRIGDKATNEGHLCTTSGWAEEYLKEHPEDDLSLPIGFEAKTIDDTRRMAVAFASAVR